MFFTLKYYTFYDTSKVPVFEDTVPTLADAMERARDATKITDCGIVEIYDSHGQFIIHFQDGELRHGYE